MQFDANHWASRSKADQLFVYDFERWPLALRLRLNLEKLERNVGNKLATKIKQRLRRGVDGDGLAIPQAATASNKPLNRTGELIRSIRYKDGFVAPGWSKLRTEKAKRKIEMTDPATGKRKTVMRTSSVKSNFGLMIVLLASKNFSSKAKFRKDGSPKKRPPQYGDLMGSESESQAKLVEGLIKTEVARQLSEGQYGLIAEMRSVLKASRRGRR